MDNASDSRAVAERQDRIKNREAKMLDDIKVLLKIPAGKRYFRELMRRGGIHSTTFTGNSHSMFLEGNRNFALSVLSDVRAADRASYLDVLDKHEEEYDA